MVADTCLGKEQPLGAQKDAISQLFDPRILAFFFNVNTEMACAPTAQGGRR